MSHGIMELDRGVVHGDTWHKIPSYITQDKPVTTLQARDILKYKLEKRPLFWEGPNGPEEVKGCHCIIRTDHNKVISASVGDRFDAMDNSYLFDFIDEHLLSQYKQLKIESVGTLFNGKIAFVNLQVDEFKIKHDKSPTVCKLMYYNPIGSGAYRTGAHNTRIVCNNTLRMATSQAAANKTLRRIHHTQRAAELINEALIDLSEFFLGLEKDKEMLTLLAEQDISTKEVDLFLKTLFATEKTSDQARAIAQNKRADVKHIYNMEQGCKSGTKYALLQAVTNYYDHQEPRANQDVMSLQWDGLVGKRADAKAHAFNILTA